MTDGILVDQRPYETMELQSRMCSVDTISLGGQSITWIFNELVLWEVEFDRMGNVTGIYY